MLLFILFSLFLILSLRKGASIATLLSVLYLFSLSALYLWSPSRFFQNHFTFFNLIYLVVFYTFMILAWDRYKLKRPIQLEAGEKELRIFEKSKYIGLIVLLINIYFFYILSSSVVDFSAYKNQGESSYYQSQLPIHGILLTLFNWFSLIFLLFLPYHFYFLSKGKTKQAVISLLISLNYVLVGLSGFSRSGMVAFILVYLILYLYFRKTIKIKATPKIVVPIMGIIFIIAVAFYSITMNRFGDDNIAVSESFVSNDPVIEDPIVNAQLSYFSQWYVKTDYWLPRSSNVELTHGSRSFPLAALILSVLRITEHFPEYLERDLNKQLGSDSASFLGISTNMALDVGPILSLLLVFLYFRYLKKKERITHNSHSIIAFMPVVFMLQVAATGIFSSILNDLNWHIIVFGYLAFLLIKKTRIA